MSRSNVDHTEHLTVIKNTKPFDTRVLMFEQCPRSEVPEKIKVKVITPEIKESDKSVVCVFLSFLFFYYYSFNLLFLSMQSQRI